MKRYQDIGQLLLRLAMAATFLTAVASRFGLLGKESSGWDGFLSYTSETISFAPAKMISFLAISSTVLETIFSILLIIGLKTRWVATGAAFLLLLFSFAMAYSYGIKSPLDYSVFVDCAACFLLTTIPYYRWSMDEWLTNKLS